MMMTQTVKTEVSLTPEQVELSEKLTHLQRMTIIGLVQGKSQRKAYRDAGGKSKSDRTADAVVCKMLTNANVHLFYNSLVKSVTAGSVLTRTEALEKLTEIARGDEQRSTMQAIKQITDMQGWEEPKRTELTGENGGPIAITQIERVIV
jgi:hypothetical protein